MNGFRWWARKRGRSSLGIESMRCYEVMQRLSNIPEQPLESQKSVSGHPYKELNVGIVPFCNV